LSILASDVQKIGGSFPELLLPTLRRFAGDEHPAIRAVILRRLPYLQSKNFELGWSLFHAAMRDADGLWKIAEPCLYYAYHNNFAVVEPLLKRLRCEGKEKDLETWGRISALCALSKHINIADVIQDLKALDATEAWLGAASVWAHTENIQQQGEGCFAGLEAGLNASGAHALAVAEKLERIFGDQTPPVFAPIELIRKCFSTFENDSHSERKHHRLYGFHKWLNTIAEYDTELALEALRIYLAYVKKSQPYL